MQNIYPAIQLHIPATAKTPEIIYNKEFGEISIVGRSHPEESKSFNAPIFDILKNIIFDSNENVSIKIQLDYINTSSCMSFLDFFKLIDVLYQSKKNFKVKWLHEMGDQDAIDRAKLFHEQVSFSILSNVK